MRQLSLVGTIALVLASQGCTLKIPTALLNGGLFNAVNATPASAPPGQVVTAKTPPPPAEIKPAPPGQACTRDALEVLLRFDYNHDKALEFEEFAPWYQAMAGMNVCTDEEPMLGEHDGPLIANNGGLIKNNAAGLARAAGATRRVQSTIAVSGHGVIISNNSGVIIAGNGAGLISNGVGGLISNNAGGLISNNSGPLPPDMDGGPAPEPMLPCNGPAPDPKSAFAKADLNGDGRLDLGELCQFPFFPVRLPKAPVVFPPTKPPVPVGIDCKSGFLKADLNQDGFVTPDEFFKARGVPFAGAPLAANQPLPPEFVNAIMISNKGDFARRDINGDGRIDAGEWCNYQPGPIPLPRPSIRPLPPVPMPAPCDLATADLDGDGYVSWEEYYQANTPVFNGADDVAAYGDAKGLAYAGFKAMDLNGDGKLDKTEVCAPPPPPTDPQPVPSYIPVDNNDSGKCGSLFDTWDADGDQQISFEEYADAKWNELRFIKAPTADEEQNTRTRFMLEAKGYDTDDNGSLDFIEFLKVCPVYVPNSVATTAPNTAVPTPTPMPILSTGGAFTK